MSHRTLREISARSGKRASCLGIVAIVALLLPLPEVSHAELYKWVDAQGKVHYSNTPVAGAKETAPKGGRFGFNQSGTTTGRGIAYSGSQPSVAIDLEFPIEVRLEGPNRGKKLVGRKRAGPSCSVDLGAITLSTRAIVDGPALTDMAIGFNKVAQKLGYRTADEKQPPASLDVAPSRKKVDRLLVHSAITEISFDVCAPGRSVSGQVFTRSSAKMAVAWKIVEPISGRTVFESTTEGFHRDGTMRRSDNAIDAIAKAYARAASQLFAAQEFAALFDPGSKDLQEVADVGLAELQKIRVPPLGLQYGVGIGSFGVGFYKTFDFEGLRHSAVTVKTPKGHGSGFLLADQRYILTNYHVVQSSPTKIWVHFDRHSGVAAEIVRADPDRDVALLKMKEGVREAPLEISRSRPAVGDVIYVIGTPLDVKLNQSVTRGIVSGLRRLGGMEFYQTDAAINPGNSGGPAFNERGEVVGIAVAGLFTRDGGSMNINYLIPIEDALGRMKIAARE